MESRIKHTLCIIFERERCQLQIDATQEEKQCILPAFQAYENSFHGAGQKSSSKDDKEAWISIENYRALGEQISSKNRGEA